MMTAIIFENGRSQAVRLPKEFRFSSDEVKINRIGLNIESVNGGYERDLVAVVF